MYEALKEAVLTANSVLAASGLVHGSFGNASGADREAGVLAIKPSGVPYGELTVEAMSVVSLADGAHVSGLRPSSDAPTHLVLYRAFPALGGIVHTHSSWATSFAQAIREVPCLGTTHADSFRGAVPCSRSLSAGEIAGDYEAATGRLIVETVGDCEPLAVPAVLVASHGPFTWGVDPAAAVETAVALEEIARMAGQTLMLNALQGPIAGDLLDRHHLRKHGPDAYYGQLP